MNPKKSYTKKISLLLIISILSVNLSFFTVPPKVNGQTLFGTGITASDAWFMANGFQAAAFFNVEGPTQSAAAVTSKAPKTSLYEKA